MREVINVFFLLIIAVCTSILIIMTVVKTDLQETREIVEQNQEMIKGQLQAETYKTDVVITAYTNATNETNSDEYTALMEKPVSGWTCAVSHDLKHFLGKKVYIEGHGLRYVNDLMNRRFSNRIDLYVGKKSEAREIGKSVGKAMFLE